MQLRSKVIPVYVDIHLSQHHLLKRLFFLHWVVLGHFLKIKQKRMHLFLDSHFYSLGLVPIPHFWLLCTVICCEIRTRGSSNSVLFSRVCGSPGAMYIHRTLRTSFPISAKRPLEFWQRLHHLEKCYHLHNITSSNPWTCGAAPFTQVYFHVISTVLYNFQCAILSPPCFNFSLGVWLVLTLSYIESSS